MASMALDITQSPLVQYTWIYDFHDGTTGTVRFSSNGQFSMGVPGGNAMGGKFSLENDPNGQLCIRTSHLRTTMMLPPPEIRAREGQLSMTFGSKEYLPFTLDMKDEMAPLLSVPKATPRNSDTNESTPPPTTTPIEWHVLKGEPTAEKRFGTVAITTFYDLEPNQQDKTKWNIRSVKYTDDSYVNTELGEWNEYKGDIEKLPTYEDNYDIRVRVKEYIKDDKVLGKIFDMTVSQSFKQ